MERTEAKRNVTFSEIFACALNELSMMVLEGIETSTRGE